MPHAIISQPAGYVTLQQFLDYLQQVPPEVLAGPLLFERLDNYDNFEICPVQIILDTWHPDDTPRTLYYDKESVEYSRFEEDGRSLGQLPYGFPLLHFSDQEPDLAARNKWLKRHLLQRRPTETLPAPVQASLFEAAGTTTPPPGDSGQPGAVAGAV